MLALNIIDRIGKFFDDCGEFIKDHYDEPFFWLILFLVLLGLSLYVIRELGDK